MASTELGQLGKSVLGERFALCPRLWNIEAKPKNVAELKYGTQNRLSYKSVSDGIPLLTFSLWPPFRGKQTNMWAL